MILGLFSWWKHCSHAVEYCNNAHTNVRQNGNYQAKRNGVQQANGGKDKHGKLNYKAYHNILFYNLQGLFGNVHSGR